MNREDGDYDYENPTDGCSELYVSCSGAGGEAKLRSCSADLKYDVVSGKCLEAEFVPWCPGGKATQPTPANPPTPTPPPPFEFDCWGLDDDLYRNPVEKCSEHYVACVGFEPTFLKCFGSLKFDIWSKTCIAREYAEDCGGIPTTTQKPTTANTPQNPGIKFNCEGRPDGDYENPTEPCSQFYFSCSNEESTFRVCQLGLAFDQISGICLMPEFVPWCPGGVATTTTTPKPTPPQNPPFEFDCSERKDGNYENPYDGCTPDYVSCSGGETHFRSCTDGLVYDWATNKCLKREFVVSCPGGKATETPPQEPPRETASFDCTGLEDGFYPKSSCDESYFACVGEISEEVWCPLGLKWDEFEEMCLHPDYIKGCGGKPTPFAPPTTKEPTPTPKPDPECQSRGPGRYPAEQGCTKRYYICTLEDVRVDEECSAEGTYFDERSEQCLFRRQVDACLSNPKPPKNPPSVFCKPNSCPEHQICIEEPKICIRAPCPQFRCESFSCRGRTDGLHGGVCSRSYYVCQGYRVTKKGTCPNNLFFNGKICAKTC